MNRVFPTKVFTLVAVFVSLASAGCATTNNDKREPTKKELAVMYVNIANASIVENDYTGALQTLKEAEQLDANLPDIYYSRSLAFAGKHDLDRALEFSRKSVEMKPTSSEYRNTLGKLLLDRGSYREAELNLLMAAQDPLYRNSFKAKTNLGILNLKKGESGRAEDYFNQAILESPQAACVAYYFRGNLLLDRSQFEVALRDYEKAVKGSCANFPEAHFAIGVAYSRSKRYDKARKKFVEIKDLYPDSPVASQAMERLRYLP